MTNNKGGNIIRATIREYNAQPFTFDELYQKLCMKATGKKQPPAFCNKLLIAKVLSKMIDRQQIKFKDLGDMNWAYVLTEYLPEGETKSSYGRPAHVTVSEGAAKKKKKHTQAQSA